MTTAQAPALDPQIKPVSLMTLVDVETRKMVDTRAGRWLIGLTVLLAVLIDVALLIWGTNAELTLDTFASTSIAIQGLLFPVVGVLLVTSEWGQRTTLATFTLEPRRPRVMVAKVVAGTIVSLVLGLLSLALAVVSTVVAMQLGDVVDPWSIGLSGVAEVLLVLVLSGLTGVALGSLLRIGAAAIVAAYAIPIVWGLLTFSSFLRDLGGWLDLPSTMGRPAEALIEHEMGAGEWGRIAVSALVWIGVATAVGIARLQRAEMK